MQDDLDTHAFHRNTINPEARENADLHKIEAAVVSMIDEDLKENGSFQEREEPGHPREERVLTALGYVSSNLIGEIGEQAFESFLKVQSAYVAEAFYRLPWNEQVFINEGEFGRKHYQQHVDLTTQEFHLLQIVCDRVGLSLDKEKRIFDIPEYEPKIERLTHTEVPEATQFLEEARRSSNIGAYFYVNTEYLSTRAKVKILTELTDEEFNQFKSYGKQFDSIDQSTWPERYIIAGQLRREDPEDYPITWDAEFLDLDPRFQEGDRLPRNDYSGKPVHYDEAIGIAKLNYTTHFLDIIYQYVDTGKDRIQGLTAESLYTGVQKYVTELEAMAKPKANLQLKDIVDAIQFYKRYPKLGKYVDMETMARLEEVTQGLQRYIEKETAE
jgi:hypothetical protein